MEGDWRGRIEIKACILTDYSIATPVREYISGYAVCLRCMVTRECTWASAVTFCINKLQAILWLQFNHNRPCEILLCFS